MSTSSPPRRLKIIYSPVFKSHRPPPRQAHPECPERLDACVKFLKDDASLSPLLDWTEPPPVVGESGAARRAEVLEHVLATHDEGYIDRLTNLSAHGGGLDSDTYVAPGSFDVSLLATSAWLHAVDLVLAGESCVWVLARPPGHHAGKTGGSGFCLINHVAVMANYAREKVSSVGVLDYDVHHGNGTEDLLKGVDGVRFVSSHQWPWYPGSGKEGDDGNVRNLNVDEGDEGGEAFLQRFKDEMVGWVKDSELILVSAGFDALKEDPLAGLEWSPKDYYRFTEEIMKGVADGGGAVFGLEGGYDLSEDGVGGGVREGVRGYCFGNWHKNDVEKSPKSVTAKGDKEEDVRGLESEEKVTRKERKSRK